MDEISSGEGSPSKRENNATRRRGVPSRFASFTRGRSNFSSGTLPKRSKESAPVNTLTTDKSRRIMLTTYRMENDMLIENTDVHAVASSSSVVHLDTEEIDSKSCDQHASFGESLSPPQDAPCPSVHSSYIDRFACPVTRMYLNDYLFHPRLRTEPQHRCSLPSTHILFEKNKHRGGANVIEQEKVAQMLRAKAAEELDCHVTDEKSKTEDAELSLDIRLIGPINDDNILYLKSNNDYMKDFFGELMKRKCDIQQLEWSKIGVLPRASYEQQLYVIEGYVVLNKIKHVKHSEILFIKFVEDLSRELKFMLHEQVHFDVPKLSSLFPKIIPHHQDVDITGIAFGSCPSSGLFFVRGDYITQENAICSFKLYPPNSNDASRESHAFKVAGSNRFLSYGRFEHDRRQCLLYFGVKLPDNPSDGLAYAGYRLTIYYNSLVKIVVDISHQKWNTLYIQLKHPPQLWEAIPKSSTFHPSKSRVLNMETCLDWVRVLSWAADEEKRSAGCSEDAFAQSNWIRLTFPKENEMEESSAEEFMEIVSRLSVRSSAKIVFGPVFAIRRKLSPSPPLHSLGSFRANYAIHALLTRGSIITDQLFDPVGTKMSDEPGRPIALENEPLFLKIVRRSMKECSQACEETLEQILNAVDERRSISLLEAFWLLYNMRRQQYQRFLSGEKIQDIGLSKPLPKNCVAVPKIMVCPTRCLLMAPEVMMVNRVVRKFGPEYALRCVFRDDNGGRLVLRDFSLGNIDHMSNIISEIIYKTLKYGIPIADRLYSFLGWSNSQMRDQGCYLYAPRVDPITGIVSGTVEEIREWMGDFREAISVPKMMSRMGQCFTQAQPTIKLLPKHWIVEQDIEGGIDDKYCFSDGCGRISWKFAQKISRILKLKEVPSCFQVRFKGFKGIVVVDPMIDYVDLPKVIFRKSQKKFMDNSGGTKPDYLEVVKYAMPSPVCLNRPFITILDHVSEKQSSTSHERIISRIHYYLERELSLLSNMLINEKCAAEELMKRTNLPIDWIMASNMCGFHLTTDPFVRSMIVSVYRYNIVHHISKAKIFLPGNMGRSMYGVVDETGLLQHGQVFIQYSPSLSQKSKNPILLKGKVLITKNPCHVPGDVRVFDAVYQPSLSHLVDVVVFPQHGPRPHPDEMAGSDLDGDEYSVIWDQDMLLDYNEKAMIFPSSSAVEEDKEPTTDDMVEFFLKFLQQDSIGRMSNAHLAFADYNGLFHEHCHSIALKCAVAVDFPKSGVPAEPLANYEQCDVSPDYMVSGGKPMYYSTRLNGQLYRKARKVEEILEEYEKRGSLFEGDYDRVICPDDIDVFFGNEKLLWAAIAIRNEYGRRIQLLLDEYGIEDEASIVSGHAAIIKRLAGMEKDDYSFYHTDKVVELRYEKLYSSFRQKFFEEFGGEEQYTVQENRKTYIRCTPAMHEKIRQWYYVSYVMPRKSHSGSIVGQSLPWVVWEVLCDLRKNLILAKDIIMYRIKSPIANRLTGEIRESIEQKRDAFLAFNELVNEESGALFLRRYSQVYGKQLIEIVFIIDQWLRAENILPSQCMNIWHIGRLLIQFALGMMYCKCKIDYERLNMNTEPILRVMLSEEADESEQPISTDLDIGNLMMEFIRYLSSESFASARNIRLKVYSDQKTIEPIIFRRSQWISVHSIAYRTFHSIAVSGTFDALHLTENDENLYISESRDPILVNESLFSSKNYNDAPLSRHRVIAALKQWSGVKSIIPRENSGRKSDLVFITSVGTVLARQRLARLLLLNGETIRDAIVNDRVPIEVRDDFL